MSKAAFPTNKKRPGSLKVRGALMLVQVALPFGLYVELRGESGLAAGLIAGAYLLSMLYLVWLG